MKTGSKGIALIKEFEGERLTAYPDPATGGAPWTIGIGHTGPEVKKGLKITAEQSLAYLRADLVKFETGVAEALSSPGSTTPNQFDAMVALAFNIGLGNFRSSTLLRKHNAKDHAGATAEFAKWNKANKKIMAGLTRRRAAEAALYAS